jgi:hypothetical protein
MHNLGPSDTWIALNIQGDVGPLTLYTSARGKLVGFLRAPPLNPPTPTQEAIRDIFRDAATAWRALTRAQRADWKRLANRANLGITGYNLFTWYTRHRDYPSIHVLELKTGIEVALPP